MMIGLQRAEGLALALVGLAAFWINGESWWLFAALILVPDISFAGYLGGPVLGAYVYNALHSYIAPALLFAAATVGGWPTALAVSLVWIVHIGADRALGYGLKLTSGFRDTHLGRIGRD
jgi:uncharacterized membrane protein YoaT (DUF817 family)